MRLLIADDNTAMRATIKKFVHSIASEIIECATGNDAVALYELHHPHYVLMDIEMPGMDGLSATQSIREMHHDARIIILTQYSEESFRVASRHAGAIGFVTKDNIHEL